MKDDKFFQKFNIEINSDWDLENNTKEIFKILHYFGIYEN